MPSIINNKAELEPFVLPRTDGLDVKFVGYKVGEAWESPDRASGDYSGRVGHWTGLVLYQTKSGKFVCRRSDYSQWENSQTQHEVSVCSRVEEMLDFFGSDPLAKSLYDDAGIEAVVEID